jgi:hypothetical protein
MSVRSPGSAMSCLTASKLSGDDDRRDDRHEPDERPAVSRGEDEYADDHAEDGPDDHVAGRRLQDQAEPDRHRRVAEHGDHGAMARWHRVDLLEPAQAVGGLDGAALGLLHELVQRRDLIEP